jgi:anti-sigma B factor antagonist
MPLATNDDGTLVILRVDGAIDSNLGAEMRTAAAQALAAGRKRFLVNLQRAKQANSTGLEALVSTARDVGAGGGKLALVGSSPLLADILKATRLDRRFAMFESTEQAIAVLRREH